MKRNYPLLLASQFFSALGDNAVLVVILGPIMAKVRAGEVSPHDQSVANILYTALLFVPYVLLAPLAGYLSDRYAKTQTLVWGNSLKLVGTAIAASSLSLGSQMLGVGYFVVGIGAAIYSPGKYGILPEILPSERLVKANGSVELLTLVAILLGTIVGAQLVDHQPLAICYLAVAGVYGGSLALNMLMQRTPVNPVVKLGASVAAFWEHTRLLLTHARLGRMLVGTCLFWIAGALMKMNFQPWGQQVLGFTTATQVALLGLWLSIGVMVGSVLAGQLYKLGELQATRRWGMALAAGVGLMGSIGWLKHILPIAPGTLAIGGLILCGVMAGLFLIPLNAGLQGESPEDKLGKTIAVQNAVENLAMVGASGFALLNVQVGFDPSQLFLALAGLVAVASFWLGFPETSNAR